MITTIRYNVNANSANSRLSFNALKDAGLNPTFRSGFRDLKGSWLCVDVDTTSEKFKLAKKFLHDERFNQSIH